VILGSFLGQFLQPLGAGSLAPPAVIFGLKRMTGDIEMRYPGSDQGESNGCQSALKFDP